MTRCASSVSGCTPTGRTWFPPTPSTAVRVPGQRQLDLPGYPGGFDLAGNRVNRQFQLDGLGEALLLLAAAARHDRLDAEGWRAAGIAADAVSQALAGAGRGDMGDRQPGLDAQPADLRGRPACRGPQL